MKTAKKNYRSYNREFKLSGIKWFKEHGKNISATAQEFGVGRKRIREWVQNEEKINSMGKHEKRDGGGRRAFYPLVEKKLKDEFLEKRTNGLAVKMWWLRSRAKELMREFYPEVDNFKYSDHWMRLFLKHSRISLRRKTHVSQKNPQDASPRILKFHKRLLQVRSGVYQAKDISNMDQTPLASS